MVVEADIYLSRLSNRVVSANGNGVTGRMRHENIDRLVAAGMRAQMRSGNLVTGENFIAFDFFPKVKPAKVDWAKAVPVFPTVPGKLTRLEEELSETLDGVQSAMKNMNALLLRLDKEVTPEITQTLADARRTLASADKLLSSDAPTQQELRTTLREVAKAATALKQLADLLERQPESLLRGKRGDEE